jgi:hypothetical protein
MSFNKKFSISLMFFVLLLATVAPALAQVTGAVFTTDSTCSGVDVNIYDLKSDVYLDGGPHHSGSAGLPPGLYYVQVTDPSGAFVLGQSGDQVEVDANGDFVACYQLSVILRTASSGFTVAGYDDTPNTGGEYKVWVSMDWNFENSETKTDNFKVEESVQPPPPTGTLEVIKFYDANLNGINDDNQPITGWRVTITSIGVVYTPYSASVLVGPYTVTESNPIESNWLHTTPTFKDIVVDEGETERVEFGNVCLGAGGGLTLGFWSNKNGQALFGEGDRLEMVALNLRNATGAPFDPASYTAFRTWILNATATNMAYMLSAQLATMRLNVYNGFVSGNALIYAPGTNSANLLGFATVNAVIAEANASLGAFGYTLYGHPQRAYQEALKNALDKANNNLNFLQATPCAFSFPPLS